MPKYIVEREIPGAGNISTEEMRAISQESCAVTSQMGPQIQRIESYVTDDKVYCVYIATNEEVVRQHSRRGGFPINHISMVRSLMDSTTAEG
jgi:hypothetical protein